MRSDHPIDLTRFNLSDVVPDLRRGLKEQAFKSDVAALVYVTPSEGEDCSDGRPGVRPVNYHFTLKGDYAMFLVWRHGEGKTEIKPYYNLGGEKLQLTGQVATQEYVVLMPKSNYARLVKKNRLSQCKKAIAKIMDGVTLDSIAVEIRALLGRAEHSASFALMGLSRALTETQVAVLVSGGLARQEAIERWLQQQKHQAGIALSVDAFGASRFGGAAGMVGSPRSDTSEGVRTPVSASDHSTHSTRSDSDRSSVSVTPKPECRSIETQTEVSLLPIRQEVGADVQVFHPIKRPPAVKVAAEPVERLQVVEAVVVDAPVDLTVQTTPARPAKPVKSTATKQRSARSIRASRHAGLFATAVTAGLAMAAAAYWSSSDMKPKMK